MSVCLWVGACMCMCVYIFIIVCVIAKVNVCMWYVCVRGLIGG